MDKAELIKKALEDIEAAASADTTYEGQCAWSLTALARLLAAQMLPDDNQPAADDVHQILERAGRSVWDEAAGKWRDQPAAQPQTEPVCPLCGGIVSYYTIHDGQWAFDCDNSGCHFVQMIVSGNLATARLIFARITGQAGAR